MCGKFATKSMRKVLKSSPRARHPVKHLQAVGANCLQPSGSAKLDFTACRCDGNSLMDCVTKTRSGQEAAPPARPLLLLTIWSQPYCLVPDPLIESGHNFIDEIDIFRFLSGEYNLLALRAVLLLPRRDRVFARREAL